MTRRPPPTRASLPLPAALLVLAAGLMPASCMSFPVHEADLFDPRRTITPETFGYAGATLEELTLSSAQQGVQLSGWWLEVDGARATVLLLGGRDFHLVHSMGYLDTFHRLRVNALLVEYRGFGRSGGEPSLDAITADAQVLYRYLTEQRGVDRSRLIVHGHSVGTFPALTVADLRPVGGVVLENPVTRADDWARRLLPWYARLFVRLDFDPALRRYDSRTLIRLVRDPVLIAAGSADRLVPAELARELHGEAGSDRKELVVVDGGGHNNLHRFEEYRAAYERLVRAVSGRGRGSD